MNYVIDTCFFRELISNYKRAVFPEIWGSLEQLIEEGIVSSVDQSYKELELQLGNKDENWAWFKERKEIFHIPSNSEAEIVREIFTYEKFQESVSEQSIRKGTPVADPFIVARASHTSGIVVTAERFKENSARIPNVCKKLSVHYLTRDEFLTILRSV